MSVSRAQVKRIALSFPGAQKTTHHGRPSFHIGKTFFTWVREEEDSLAVRVGSIDERDMLIESDPALYHITDHYRDWPTLLVRLKAATPETIRTILEQRFRAIATKRQLAEWEARG